MSQLQKRTIVRCPLSQAPVYLDRFFAERAAAISIGGPYPTLAGTLEIEADEEYTSCRLALVGTYVPPLSAAVKVFDAVLGHRIALAR